MRIGKQPVSPLLKSLRDEKSESKEPISTIWSENDPNGPQADSDSEGEPADLPPEGEDSTEPMAAGTSAADQPQERIELPTEQAGTGACKEPAEPPAPSDGSPAQARPARRDAATAAAAASKALPRPPSRKQVTKLVRVVFSLPPDYADLADRLQDRLVQIRIQRQWSPSELLYAGLKALAALDDAQLKALLDRIGTLEKGRYCHVQWTVDDKVGDLSAVMMSSGEYHILIPSKE